MHNLIRTGPLKRAGRPGEKCFDLGAFARLAGNGQRPAQLVDPFRHSSHSALALAARINDGHKALPIVTDQQLQALGHSLEADQQVLCLGMSQHIGDRFLGNAKCRDRRFFGYSGQALVAFQAPVHSGVGQGLEQVRAQTGFKAQAGQLPGVEDGRYIADFGEGFFQRVAKYRTLSLKLCWHPAFEPVTLQFCRREQLTNVVVQFATESVTLVFLDLQQAISQLLRLEFDRFARQAILRPDTTKGRDIEDQQAKGQAAGQAVHDQAAECRADAQQEGEPASTCSGRSPQDD